MDIMIFDDYFDMLCVLLSFCKLDVQLIYVVYLKVFECEVVLFELLIDDLFEWIGFVVWLYDEVIDVWCKLCLCLLVWEEVCVCGYVVWCYIFGGVVEVVVILVGCVCLWVWWV